MTYSETLVVWWSFFWRGVLAGFAAGAAAGFAVGVVAGLMGVPENGAIWGGIAGWIVGLPVSVWALRAALTKCGYQKVT